MDAPAVDCGDLDDDDVRALRLAAQVMAHKGALVGRPLVADYFSRLEDALKNHAARREAGDSAPLELRDAVAAAAGAQDHRLVAEYLGLLIANERLSPALREVCRRLRARDSR